MSYEEAVRKAKECAKQEQRLVYVYLDQEEGTFEIMTDDPPESYIRWRILPNGEVWEMKSRVLKVKELISILSMLPQEAEVHGRTSGDSNGGVFAVDNVMTWSDKEIEISGD